MKIGDLYTYKIHDITPYERKVIRIVDIATPIYYQYYTQQSGLLTIGAINKEFGMRSEDEFLNNYELCPDEYMAHLFGLKYPIKESKERLRTLLDSISKNPPKKLNHLFLGTPITIRYNDGESAGG